MKSLKRDYVLLRTTLVLKFNFITCRPVNSPRCSRSLPNEHPSQDLTDLINRSNLP